MSVTVRQLAELVRGSVLGDCDLAIQSARTLHEAQPGDVTFLDDPQQGAMLLQTRASAVVAPFMPAAHAKTLIQVDDPLFAFTAIFQYLHGKKKPAPTGIDARAIVHPSAQIGADPSIEAFVVIGPDARIGDRCRLYAGAVLGTNCRLGDDVVLFPGVVLYDDTVVGDGTILHARDVLGADGFGYRFQNGNYGKIPQLGNVVVGKNVEVGANTTIDRGTFGSTDIGAGTKIHSLVQVAHNCQIGEHNIFAGHVGIAGSTSTGREVTLHAQVGVKDHLRLGDRVTLGTQSGLIEDAPAGKRMFLYPAREESEAALILTCLKQLPTMRKDLLRILKELNLTENLGAKPARSTEAPAA